MKNKITKNKQGLAYLPHVHSSFRKKYGEGEFKANLLEVFSNHAVGHLHGH